MILDRNQKKEFSLRMNSLNKKTIKSNNNKLKFYKILYIKNQLRINMCKINKLTRIN